MPTLNDLDAIPWERLTHAYDPATDVPAQIRGIVSADPTLREAAFKELFANIWHQGTVYEATIYALPILIDLLQTNSIPEPDRGSLALLIACILNGRGYWEVHGSVTLLNPFTKTPVPKPPDMEERIATERQIVAEVRDRGAEALSVLLPYLQHPEADIRSVVAESFERYPEKAETLVPALRAALEIEPDQEVRSRIQRSLLSLREDAGV